jgi:glycosyltransferase involved in cell wall biosynthesis
MRALYYLRVSEKYVSDWEYYQVDLDALRDLFNEVVVCDSLWKALREIRSADVIYAWWWHTSVPVILLGRLLGIKTVITGAIHMFDISGARDYYTASWAWRFLTALGLRWADANLVISHDQFRQITSHLRVRNPIVVRCSIRKVQPLGRDEVLAARRRLRDRPGAKVVFLSVAWQTDDQLKRKGVRETLEGIAALKAAGVSGFEWIVAGKVGDGTEDLRDRIRALGVGDVVTLLGDVSQEQKRELYLGADLYIQPSWCEGFGSAVLEAMSHGAPALVSRYTAQPETVGDKGLIAMDVTGAGIAERLREFMALDELGRRRLSEQALDWALTEFSYGKRLKEMSRAFADLGIQTHQS